jgi:tetratricopeptide (TPR) repeat protein
LAALEEIKADVDNARAAWDWALEPEQVAWLDRALEGLCLFFEWGDHYEEGEAACRKAVDRLGRSPLHLPTGAAPGSRLRVLARALVWQGSFNYALGRSEVADRCFDRSLVVLDNAESSDQASDVRRERAFTLVRMSQKAQDTDQQRAKQLAEHSLETYRTLGDRWGMATAYIRLGAVLYQQGALEEAKQWFEDSLSLFRALGDRWAMIRPLVQLGWSLEQMGQLEEAERVARESIAVAQQVGDHGLIEQAYGCLGAVLKSSGRFAEAQSLREKNLALCRERGAREQEVWGWLMLGVNTKHLGSYDEARASARTGLTLCQESGLRGIVPVFSVELGRLALAEGACGAAQEWLQQSIAIFQEVGERHLMMGEALATLACVARGLGQPAQARGHLRAALRIAAENHRPNTTLQSLPAVALLVMDGGEVERAVELYALASRYPFVANSRWFEDIAGQHIAAAAAALPPEVVAAAQERGRARDLWATVEELLAELEG